MINSGLAFHVHHDIMIEHCYDYNGRVDIIIREKPVNEIETRLRLFKLLSPEAMADLPDKISKARQEWDKAWQKYDKARQEKFHSVYCGCKEWNGREIVFKMEK